MAPKPFKVDPAALAAAMGAILIIELLAGWVLRALPLPAYGRLGMVRALQSAAIVAIFLFRGQGLNTLGWAPRDWPRGIRIGMFWSLGFGAAALLGMVLIHLVGHYPLQWLRIPLPRRNVELVLLFLVGGLIGPLAEELFFRGVLYAYFRRWGIAAALAASTAIFALLHFNAVPVTQVVGGLVFALAYERHRNLMVPIVIHVLGNSVLFA
ncbi:MAG: CPBP family intramembrane metalloprotease, partial [Desulfatitalea sp.]|nr:CPBP family intramembrane metalloprotease [Desulfatitalea sp.]NNK00670.1 CPBP family intramembrane metalloprotease [Desulfatitalea sp.]